MLFTKVLKPTTKSLLIKVSFRQGYGKSKKRTVKTIKAMEETTTRYVKRSEIVSVEVNKPTECGWYLYSPGIKIFGLTIKKPGVYSSFFKSMYVGPVDEVENVFLDPETLALMNKPSVLVTIRDQRPYEIHFNCFEDALIWSEELMKTASCEPQYVLEYDSNRVNPKYVYKDNFIKL
jgi:hypothetical protein